MKTVRIDQKFLDAIEQIQRGLNLRVGRFPGRVQEFGVVVNDKLVAQFAATFMFDVLLVTIEDIDPDIFIWEDDPQTEWVVRLDKDFDLEEIIEVLSDHVISHLERQGVR